MAFLKGRIDGNLAIVDKRLADRPFVLGNRPTIADLSLVAYLYYPADEFGFDIAAEHKNIARLARSHQGAAGLEASLRPDAGLSAAGTRESAAARPPVMLSEATRSADVSKHGRRFAALDVILRDAALRDARSG